MSKTEKKPLMRRFYVTFTAEVELSQDVLDHALSKDFSNGELDLACPEDVAAHVGYEMVFNGWDYITQLEGFEELKDNDAVLTDFRVDYSEESSEEE